MPDFPSKIIEKKLCAIKSNYKDELQDLQDLLPEGGRVLNLGCTIGSETMALMWFLDAGEVIGVDNTHGSIFNARQDLNTLNDDLDKCKLVVDSNLVSRDSPETEWWNNLPPFLRERRFPTFEKLDIASERDFIDKVGPHPFDLVYCSSVLYQVHDKQGKKSVISATKNICSVVISGGWFIANEPCRKDLDYFEKEMINVGFDVTVLCKNGRPEFRCQRLN